jgi:hypothetical protein
VRNNNKDKISNRVNKYDDYLSQLGGTYLMDLIHILKFEAIDCMNACRDAEDKFLANGGSLDEQGGSVEKLAYSREFWKGYALAYSRVIAVLIKQANIFCIPLEELCLDDIDTGKDIFWYW